MKLTLEKFNGCIDQFVRAVVEPNAKMNTQFKIGWAREFGMLSVDEEKLKSMIEMGVADKDGNIDIDLIKRGIYAGLKSSGEYYVEKLGIYLSRNDFDKFFKLCETGAIG